MVNSVFSQKNFSANTKTRSLSNYTEISNFVIDEEVYLDFDFKDSLPHGWITYDNNNLNNTFVWSDSLRHGAYGDFGNGLVFLTEPVDAIQSYTDTNGYAVFHADYYNCLDGDFPLSIDPNYIEMHSVLETDWLNIGNQDSVYLQFDTWFRTCCSESDQLLVEVSSDSMNWISFDVKNNNPTNSTPPRTFYRHRVRKIFQLDTITSLDPTHFKIRWCFNGASHYHMEIDDVKLLNPISSLTRRKVFNYEIGDILYIKDGQNNEYGYHTSISKTVIYKSISTDLKTITYKFSNHTVQQWPDGNESWDTTQVTYSNLDEFITYSQGFDSWYTSEGSNYNLIEITKTYDYGGREVLEYFFGDGFETGIAIKFVEGLGGQYYSYWNAGEYFNDYYTLDNYFKAEDGVNIREIEIKPFKIYPNPSVNDMFIIQISDKKIIDMQMKIYNIRGQLVDKKVIRSLNNQISTKKWGKGIFFLQISNQTEKIIIQ